MLLIFSPLMFEILTTPEETAMIFSSREIRHVYTDGRPHTPNEDLWPTPWGDSIGHWEGQTLVIDTIEVSSPASLGGGGPVIVAGGFLLLLRVDAATPYWTALFPAIVVMAVGMAGAVAPLTTAVLGSVDAQHTGSASGFNSAVARTGGLIATALLGGVLAATGENLFAAFHQAVIVCAMVCVAAGASAFLFVGKRSA